MARAEELRALVERVRTTLRTDPGPTLTRDGSHVLVGRLRPLSGVSSPMPAPPFSARDVAQSYAMRSEAYLGRMLLLTSLASRERKMRLWVTIVTFSIATMAVCLQWSHLDPRVMFIIFVAAVVHRLILNGIVSMWAASEIRRVKAEFPLEGESP